MPETEDKYTKINSDQWWMHKRYVEGVDAYICIFIHERVENVVK